MSLKIIIIGVSILLLFTLFCMIILGGNGLVDLNRLEKEKSALVRENQKKESENLALYKEIERLTNDPVYIENFARQELGMISEDELILTFKDKKKNSKK